MPHEWKDFHPDDGPLLPLSSGQQAPLVSGVLPSGEGHFLDHRQSRERVHSNSIGSGINFPYPHPNLNTPDDEAFLSQQNPSDFPDQFDDEWWDTSGIFKTYPEDPSTPTDGMFRPENLKIPFSNSSVAQSGEIENFTVFNPYIHHYKLSSALPPITIPYISQYFLSSMSFIESFSSEWVEEQEEENDD